MGNLSDMLIDFLVVEDEAAKPVQDAILRAIVEDMDVARALGVRGSLRLAFYRAMRDKALQIGAAVYDSVGAFVQEYQTWKAKGRPAWDPGLVDLFEDLAEAERMGVELPGSDSQLRRLTRCG